MTDIKPPRFPVGTVVFSHVFHDPGTTKTVYAAKWDGAEYRYTLQDASGTQDYGYLDKDLIAQDADLIDLDDAKRIIALRDWLYSDGQYWSERDKEIDALFTENDRLRLSLHWIAQHSSDDLAISCARATLGDTK